MFVELGVLTGNNRRDGWSLTFPTQNGRGE